jgi:hypothetical protein
MTTIQFDGQFKTILEPFTVYRQETDHTCGPAALRMALDFLGNPQSEKTLELHCLTLPTGALHFPVLWAYDRFLKPLGLKVEMSQDDPAVYEKVKQSLASGWPVLFIFSVEDVFHPPSNVMHYSLVIGIDEPSGVVLVANPFGTIENLPIEEWWDRFSHAAPYASVLTELLVKTNILKPRMCYIVGNG